MDFQTNKTLGGVGAILLLIGCLFFINAIFGLIGLIGFILYLIALGGFADYYSEKGIFNNALYGFIIFIIGVVVTFAVAVFVLVDFLTSIGIDLTNWQSLQSIDWASIITPEIISAAENSSGRLLKRPMILRSRQRINKGMSVNGS